MSEEAQALLVVDVQVGTIFPGDPLDQAVLQNIIELIRRARERDVPVVYMQHESLNPGDTLVPGNPDWPIHPAVAPMPGEAVLHKHSSDSFHHTELDAVLHRLGVGHIAVVGCASDYCVDTTCRSALSHGYDVTLVADGHVTGPDGDLTVEAIIAHHNRTLAQIAIEGARIRVLPSAEILLQNHLPEGS